MPALTFLTFSGAVVTSRLDPNVLLKGAATLAFDSACHPVFVQVRVSEDEAVTLPWSADLSIRHA